MRGRGDFTADSRLVPICALALVIGAICAVVALVLMRLIGFFTNLFYYGRISLTMASPAGNHLGVWAVLVPVVGGLVVGLMARYGSDKIRGHGIPEAMEAILIGRSRMEPKVAALKPLSSAICIGSGGPFGAEGPIIMTGGAFGSIIAQWFHLTAAERKTLLVAGAAGGMSATFAAPVAAVLLAVELLLFEWKPRSLLPVALASAVAAALRPHLLGAGPLFPTAAHADLGTLSLFACIGVGLLGGAASSLLTWGVYAAEDGFHRLPLHWMWWPLFGGLAVGIGGLLQPRALGVGYDIIGDLLQGRLHGGGTLAMALLGLLIVKAVIWAVDLGSGTSGGVLAPLLIMGGALGALEQPFLPADGHALWPLISMAAVLGGAMRAPLMGVVFALELTHDVNALLPLMIGCMTAHAFTVLVLPRSILTEKVARRGYHLSCEYSVDPLEVLSVDEVMTPDVISVPSDLPLAELQQRFVDGDEPYIHQGYPVLDENQRLVGVVTRSNLIRERNSNGSVRRVLDLISQPPAIAYADESCRAAAERMAELGVGRLPVVDRKDPQRVTGMVTRSDLLKARQRYMDSEQVRERPISPIWANRS